MKFLANPILSKKHTYLKNPTAQLDNVPTACLKFHFSKWLTARVGLFNLGTVGIWGWVILCGGGCFVHGGVFSNIPGLYTLNASS